MTVITFAHRGARLLAPENTIAAFQRALEAGVTGLETDAHLSADGEVVLVHDGVVRRGLRRLRVAATPASDLVAAGIPRLADLYETCGTDFELSVDLKAPGVGPAVVRVAERYGAAARLWLCAADVEVVTGLVGAGGSAVHSTRKDRLDVPIERHAARLAEHGVAAMNLHHTEWTAGLVSLFHRFDVRAFAWDAQEVRHVRAMLRIGVDAVYGDDPYRLAATVGEWAGPS